MGIILVCHTAKPAHFSSTFLSRGNVTLTSTLYVICQANVCPDAEEKLHSTATVTINVNLRPFARQHLPHPLLSPAAF
jgi:hypothetical protein